MADLNELNASQSIKLAGAGPTTGIETNYVQVDANGNMFFNTRDSSGNETAIRANPIYVSEVLDGSGVHGNITVSTTAIACRVGASNLTLRKRLTVTNATVATTNNTLYWGYSNTVTTTTGTPLAKGAFLSDSWGANTTIYIIAISGSHDVRITEGA